MEKMMQEHFEDDKKAFTDIADSFKRIEKMLSEQNKSSEEHRDLVKSHMERVEPMISSYEIDTRFNKEFGIKTKKWGIRLGLLASAIASWYVIKAFIVANFLK